MLIFCIRFKATFRVLASRAEEMIERPSIGQQLIEEEATNSPWLVRFCFTRGEESDQVN